MQARLRAALAHPLLATGLRGAYLSAPPPTDFHAAKASAKTLLRHGYYWRRPQDGDDPVLFQAWNHHLGRDWSPDKRIVPRFVVKRGKTHRPVRRSLAGRPANEISNWGGGVLAGTWTSASASWVVPTVTQPAEAPGIDGGWDSSSWVGLDGSGSNDVLQAGVEQSVDSNGNASYVAWYEWFCNIQKRTLGDTSPFTPSLASHNGNLYIAWRGDGNDQLNVMVSFDAGQSFFNKNVSPESSDDAPALASDGINLYLAWKGSGNDNLNVARVAIDGNGNPQGLVDKVILGDTSPARPTLAALNGALYLGWKGDGNDNLNVMVSTDGGQSFGSKFVSPETSPVSPGLAAHNGGLYVTWKGDGNDNLNVAQVSLAGVAPNGFFNKVVLGDTSPLAPTLASLNGQLFIGWRGDGNDNLNVMVSNDNGASFGGKYVSPETSTDAPILAAHAGGLFIGWKGDGNDNLNVSMVGMDQGTITGFTTPDYVYEVQIPNFSVSPGDTVHCSVQYIANRSAGQISFGNSTNGENFQITLVPPPGAAMSGNTAEWIMEVPTIGGALAHLPSFTPVTFSSAISCGGDVGDPNNGSTVTIFDDGGNALTATTLGSLSVAIDYV